MLLRSESTGRRESPGAPSWVLSRRVFLAGLALVYGCAFCSLWSQLGGLFGSDGIQPLAERMDALRSAGVAPWRAPTLLWLGAGDATLQLLAGSGVALSIALLAGLVPRVAAALLWVLYLSFVCVGEPFLSFQWDVLLLEAGLLGTLWAPDGLAPFGRTEREPPDVVRWLLAWLLFRLMLLSGLVKLASGDELWWTLRALEHHYWTQPLPHRLSHLAHHLGSWIHVVSAAAMFAIELVLPFFVFGPRRLRIAAAAGISLFMLAITATGNYGFFNLLTVVLCVPLLDDAALRRLLPPLPFIGRRPTRPARPPRFPAARRVLLGGFAALALLLTSLRFMQRLGSLRAPPAPVAALQRLAAPFASFNAYGLFADMTESRPEVVIESSHDGQTWTPCEFRWKPGALDRAPGFAGLHMPRLDWQMWFAALQGPRDWYARFLQRLLEGSPEVLDLLGERLPPGPPKYLRSTLYRYEFSSPSERAQGVWWRRTRVGAFFPTLTLEPGGGLRAVSR